MRVDLFDFDLPPDRIALHPARPRDSARLLHAPASGEMEDRIVRDLPSLLRPGDLLVVNDTRVIPAALAGVRAARGDGAPIGVEVNLHKREGAGVWRAFARPGKRLREGDVIAFGETLSARIAAKVDTNRAAKMAGHSAAITSRCSTTPTPAGTKRSERCSSRVPATLPVSASTLPL